VHTALNVIVAQMLVKARGPRAKAAVGKELRRAIGAPLVQEEWLSSVAENIWLRLTSPRNVLRHFVVPSPADAEGALADLSKQSQKIADLWGEVQACLPCSDEFPKQCMVERCWLHGRLEVEAGPADTGTAKESPTPDDTVPLAETPSKRKGKGGRPRTRDNLRKVVGEMDEDGGYSDIDILNAYRQRYSHEDKKYTVKDVADARYELKQASSDQPE